MINRKLRAMLLTLSFLGAPFMKAKPFTWAPVGVDVDAEGYALSSVSPDLYNYGDLIDETPGDFNSSFASTPEDCILDIYGTLRDPESADADGDGVPDEEILDADGNPIFASLKIDGDVRLDARLCNGCDMTVNINTDVAIEPYSNSAGVTQIEGSTTGVFAGSDGLCYSQVYFNAEAGRTISVNVDNNLEFRGRTVDPATEDFTDMIVTFNGQGRVFFKLADGTGVFFNGQIDDTTPILVDVNGNETLPLALNETGEEVESCVFNASGAGTKVYITMDQTVDQIACGQNKVTFLRKRRSDEVTLVDCECPACPGVVKSPKGIKAAPAQAKTRAGVVIPCPEACVDCPCECVVKPCCPTTGPCDIAPEKRVLIYVGHNSLITYLSDNLTGLPDTSGCFCTGGYGSIAFDPSNTDNAEAGIVGSGRMVLMIKGAYDISFAQDETEGTLVARYPYNDGAVVIAGHFVECDKTDPDAFTPELVRTTVDYSSPAGIQAIFAICDLVCSDAYKCRKAADRRGLLVINDVANHGKLACDPYWDLYQEPFDPVTGQGCVGALYAYSNPNKFTKDPFDCGGELDVFPPIPLNVRRGFVLGVNGLVDICHDLFLDYVAGSCNKVDDLASCCYDPCSIKERNPSAFIVDGLDPRLFCKPGCGTLFTGNPYTCATSEFEAANPFTQGDAVRKATIHLRGNAATYLRSSVSSVDCYMFNYWFEYAGDYVHEADGTPAPELDPDLDYVKHLSVGAFQTSQIGNPNCPTDIVCAEKSLYDGLALTGNTQTELVPCGGVHVLDVECDLNICSLPNTATVLDPWVSPISYREYDCTVDAAGVVQMLSVVVDHAGREIYFNEVNEPVLVNRPIFADCTIDSCCSGDNGVPLKLNEKIYCRYNSPGIFLNANMSLYESNLLHSDATKVVDGVPSNSEPAITGGEKLYYSLTELPESIVDAACGTVGEPARAVDCDPNRYRFPEIRLYNSNVHLFESLASTGLRWVVTDRPDVCSDDVHAAGTNISAIKFADHGDCWDTQLTSWGRIFMLGSNLNKMSGTETVEVAECLSCERPCTNSVLQSAYLNVFRGRVPGDDVADIRLLMQNCDQYDTCVPSNLYDLERAQHLFILGMTDKGKSNAHIGWQTGNASIDPYGDGKAFPHVYPYPGDALVSTPSALDSANIFTLDGEVFPQAVLRVDGKIITFGAFDSKGNARKVPFQGSDETGVVYVDHGGRLDITADTKTHDLDLASNAALRNIIPAELVVDTIIGQRVWSDFDSTGEFRQTAFTGCLDLPHDQVTFINNYTIQPYNFTTDMFARHRDDTNGWVRLPYINSHRGPSFDKTGGEEVSVAWHNRDCECPSNAVPVKKMGRAQKYLTRTTESLGGAVTRPGDLLFVGAGDHITQFKVFGATQADPFHLAVRGAQSNPTEALVREFVSGKTQTGLHHEHFIGEGAHAVLFVEHGGHVGLGTRNWNDHSVNAWNLIGKDYVTVCPLGDGVVDVNSNLLVTDRLPIVASSDFKAHRLTFYSEEPREIRVPANGELDLSSFGHNLAAGQHQEIAFAGQLRLVFEPGATLRLPDATSGDGLVLYFNDESQLVFEGAQSRQGSNRPRFANAAATNEYRTKILGQGQIWLNKDASMLVNGNALVGVQTDALTPITDVTVSVQRQAQFDIGTAQVAGGAFEVGNVDKISGHSIKFNLKLNGPEATFCIGRAGFVGLGAGVVNKEGVMNGNAVVENNPVTSNGVAVLGEDGLPVFTPDPAHAWTVQSLNNVAEVNLDINQGIVEHNQIADGFDADASLLAVGAIDHATLHLGGADHALVRGGGNMMEVPADGVARKVIVADYDGEMSNGSRFCVMSSGQIIRDETADDDNNDSGQTFSMTNGAGLIETLASDPLKDQAAPKVVVAENVAETLAVFVNPDPKYPVGNMINRIESPSTVQDGGNIDEAVSIGSLNAAVGVDGNPEAFTVDNQ